LSFVANFFDEVVGSAYPVLSFMPLFSHVFKLSNSFKSSAEKVLILSFVKSGCPAFYEINILLMRNHPLPRQ